MSNRHPQTISMRLTFSLTFLTVLCGLGQPPAFAQPQPTFTVLADVDAPYGGVVKGSDGAFYGTSQSGGASNCGYVYKFVPGGGLSVLHEFTQAGGCQPKGELVEGLDGAFYGTTVSGGPNVDSIVTAGTGTIYKITATGTHTLVKAFAGAVNGVHPEGRNPLAGLTLGADGIFYGMTNGGGTGDTGSFPPGGGTIFKVTPAGVLTVLHHFSPGGRFPQQGLTVGTDGNFYGTVLFGGAFDVGAGVLFKITPAGEYSQVFQFPWNQCSEPACYPLGTDPFAPPLDLGGHFFVQGVNHGPGGRGTIVDAVPDGTGIGVGTLVHAFSGSDGGNPATALTLGSDGHVYGVTYVGGANDGGTIFRITSGGIHETLHDFAFPFGSSPQGRLLEVAPGEFIGTTSGGGPTGGIVYRLSLNPNSPPSAQDGSVMTPEDTGVSGQLSASDADGDPLTFSIVANGTLGSAVITDTATGAFTYTPNANVFGTDTFTFRVTGGTSVSNVATMTVTIAPVNDAPVALDTTFPAVEDTPFSGTLQAVDVDGDALVYTIASNGTKGTAAITNASTGAFTYTPNAHASGTDTITFQVTEVGSGGLTSDVATFTIEIAPVNDAPSALTGVVTTSEGVPVSGTLQASDAEGNGVSFAITGQPTQGTVSLTDAATGAFTYTPNAGAIGYDTFTFEVSDGSAASSGTEMVFIVASSPRWPGQTVRGDVGALLAQNAAITADGRFVVFDGFGGNIVPGDTNGVQDIFVQDRLSGSVARVSVSSNGQQANGPSQHLAISADGRFVAFQSFASNLVTDDTNGQADIFVHDRITSQTARVSISTEGAQSDAMSSEPQISADGRFVVFSSPASTLVSGDTNGVSDIFLHDRVNGTTTRVSLRSDGTQDTFRSDGPSISADGRYVSFWSRAAFVPADTNDVDDVFVHDRLTGITARVSVTSIGSQSNGSSQTSILSADGRFVGFQSNASNLTPGDTNGYWDIFVHDRSSGQTVRASVADDGTQGNESSFAPSSLSADGRYISFHSNASNLVPADTNGQVDVFVRDLFTSAIRRVSVAGNGTQGDANSFPSVLTGDGRFVVFRSSAANLVAGSSGLHIYVVGGVSVTPATGTVPADGGTAGVDVNFVYPGTPWGATSNDPWITIDGQSSSAGNGTVTYSVAPNAGTSRVGTLTVAAQTVTIHQDGASAPVAQDGTVGTNEDAAVNGVLSVTDPDGGALTFSIVSNGTLGTATITDASTGAFSYAPNANAFGSDTFTFQASDGSLTSNVATITVTIASVNDAPATANGTLTTNEDTPVNGTLSAVDVDSPSLTFSIVANATKGSVIVTNAATGAYTYTPNANANGADTFTFKANDGSLDSNVATVDVTINGTNDVPVAQTGVVTTQEGAAVSGTLQATDADGGALTFTVTSTPALGTVTLTDPSTGAFTYTPEPGKTGYDTFTFQASDGVATASAMQMVFIVAATPQWPGQTRRVSVSSDGTQGNGPSYQLSNISSDGRYVVFSSDASNLVAGDTNGLTDVFVHDRQTGETRRISVSSDGIEANFGTGYLASLSEDGRYVAFSSSADNLVEGDTNGRADVFVHDRQTSETRRISIASDGTQGNNDSTWPSLSADGRHVAFYSFASNLVAGDNNGDYDVFVHDGKTGQTSLVSRASDATQGNSFSLEPSLSADGRYVAFRSGASNLVATDTNGVYDVFVHDRQTGETWRVSVATDGTDANAPSDTPSISRDGRHVAFGSAADNLIAGDTNVTEDVFVHDRQTGETRRVSVSSDGTQGNSWSLYPPSLGADGRFVAFWSLASNLVAGDTNDQEDVFVHDMRTGETRRVSVASDGTQANAYSQLPSLSADGRHVAFPSAASNLVANDTNNTFDIFVVSPGMPLVAQDGTLNTAEDTATGGTLIASGGNGATLTFTVVSNGTFGTTQITNVATGAFTYTPNVNAHGTDSFTFKANDGSTDSNLATITVTITPVNDAPVAVNGNVITGQDTPANGTLQATDVDGPSLAFVLVSNGSLGTASVADPTTGAFTYAPNAGASGTDTFTFKANDGTLDSNIATIAVEIVPAQLAVSVVAPNGGEKVFLNFPTIIRWTAAGATSIDVALSRNGGSTYTAIAGCTSLSGSATSCAWTPTGPGTNTARIRVTARAGTASAVDTSNANFTISSATPSITVTMPNTAVSWAVGTSRTISWSHNLGLGSTVNIDLSRNGGAGWEPLAASVQNTTATTGSFAWTVTGPGTTTALVRVSWSSGPVSDVSNVAFSIVAPSITLTVPNTAVTWAAGTTRTVTASHNLGAGQPVAFDVSRDGGVTWTPIGTATSAATSASLSWVVTGPPTTQARVRASWATTPAISDTSNVNFTISPRVLVTMPNTAVVWAAGSLRTVTWTHTLGAGGLVNIDVSPDNGTTWIGVAESVASATATTGSHVVRMPAIVTTQALVRVIPVSYPLDGDVSNVPFTLAVPTVRVLIPNTNVLWTIGSLQSIRWSHNLGTLESVRVEISRDGGSSWLLVTEVANSAPALGTINWTVDGPSTTAARIRVTWVADGSVQDMSDVNFRIQ